MPFRSSAEVAFVYGDVVRRRALVDGTGDGVGLLLTDQDADLHVGAVLDPLRFSLPLGPPIFATGVVRHRGEVAGVALAGLPELDRRRLEAWIRLSNRPPPSAPGCTLRSLYDTVVRFESPSGPRERAVLRASALELDVALQAGDIDLCDQTSLAAAVRFDGETMANGEAVITEIVRYRGLPVRMLLSWTRLSPEERRWLSRMAGGSAPQPAPQAPRSWRQVG